MSRATRRHPGRVRPAPAVKLTRLADGGYFDGTHTIENRNDGKRDACWVAFVGTNPHKVVAHGATLREVRRKLGRPLDEGEKRWAAATPEEQARAVGMPRPSSLDAKTRTTTRDDGEFIRTALVLVIGGGERQGGSLDVVDQDGNFLLQINISAGKDFIIVDSIDVEGRYSKRAAIAFLNKRQKRITINGKGTLVSADFRTE